MVTGGQFSIGNVVRYNEDGFVEDLPELISGRWSHACSWYINSQDKMVKKGHLIQFMFTGSSSTSDRDPPLAKKSPNLLC